MNDAGSTISLSARSSWGEMFSFSARVLYWWEVQQIRVDSLVTDKISATSFLDRSRLYGKMVDAFLEWIKDGDKTVTRSDLGPGEGWRNRLHPTVIQPIYDEYSARCSPTTQELDTFRNQVRAYFDPTLRPAGIYMVPPEIWEATVLSQMGGLSLSEIRGLSYAEMRKLLIIIEVMGGNSPVQPTVAGERDAFSGLMPAEMLFSQSQPWAPSTVEGGMPQIS